MLVLGDRASYRVWFVVDGDALFVDRNGNGDLTDPGERVALERKSRRRRGFVLETRTWKLPVLDKAGRYTGVVVRHSLLNRDHEYKRTSRQIALLRERMKAVREGTHPNQTRLELRIAGKRSQFCVVRFTTKPADAPIAHMDGPLTLGIVSPLMEYRLGLDTNLAVGVGTTGLGAGAFSFLTYDTFPKDARPFAVVTIPGRGPKRLELKEKC